MVLIANGVSDAFREVLRRHNTHVFHYVKVMVAGNEGRAEDITQNVWMKVVRSANKYEPQSQFRAWLLTIAKRTVYNEVRDRTRRKEVSTAVTDEDGATSEMDFIDERQASVHDRLEREEDVARVRAAVQELPEQQRLALILWMEESGDTPAMAKELGVTVEAFHALIYRAKKSLAKSLGKLSGKVRTLGKT